MLFFILKSLSKLAENNFFAVLLGRLVLNNVKGRVRVGLFAGWSPHWVLLRCPLFCYYYSRFGHGICKATSSAVILDVPLSHSLLLGVARSQVQDPSTSVSLYSKSTQSPLWCDSPGYEGGILLLGDFYAHYYHDWNLIPDKGNYDFFLDLKPSYLTMGRVPKGFEIQFHHQSKLWPHFSDTETRYPRISGECS